MLTLGKFTLNCPIIFLLLELCLSTVQKSEGGGGCNSYHSFTGIKFDEQQLEEEGFMLAHGLRVQYIMLGKPSGVSVWGSRIVGLLAHIPGNQV